MLVFPALFLYLCPGLCRSTYSPQLVESVHVERQVIQLSFIIGNRRVGVSVELYKPVHIIPYFPVVCMKNMRTVFMHVDAVYLFAVDIAAGVWTFLYHQTSLSGFMSLMGKHGSEQAAAYNQVIVWFHFPLALFLSSYKATQLLSGLQKKYRLLCRILIKTVVSHAIGWFLSARRAKKNLFVLFSPCFVLSLRPIRT